MNQRIYVWLHHRPCFKADMHKYDEGACTLLTVKEAILEALRTDPIWSGLDPQVLNDIATAEDVNEFDTVLDQICDYADKHRIWLGF